MPSVELPSISTPKLAAQVSGLGYHYYAGFSPDFVTDVLAYLDTSSDDLVLDPWNGSGTTTLVCAEQGIPSIGSDLSPAMVVVAKGRLCRTAADGISRRVQDLLAERAPQRPPRRDEPLCAWFQRSSASRLRWLMERATNQTGRIDVGLLSSDDCYIATALFLTIRSFMGPATTSNPTWIRRSLEPHLRIRATWDQVAARLTQACVDLAHSTSPIEVWPVLDVADTTEATTLADHRVDDSSDMATVVLTSPPYCTRIDYVASTRPELAAMGWTTGEQEAMRRLMLGTTTVEQTLTRATGFGPEAELLLEKVSTHGSRASSTYYRKWLGQYLDTYQRSIQALSLRLAPHGRAAFVVQDSFYKDVHIDLALITRQMCEAVGWRHESTIDFHVPRTMASINPRSRPYRERATVTESLLVFRKPT